MENAQKNFINIHAMMIKKLLQDYKNNKIAGNDFLQSIQSHADLIIDAAFLKES